MAPTLERGEHHEEVGGAVTFVLVIKTGRASRFHRDRHACFGNQLLRGLVDYGGFPGGPWGPRGPGGLWGPAGPVAPTGPAGPGGPATPRSPLSPFAPAGPGGPGGPAGPRNQSQPPKLSVITKTENNNIFCITQSSHFRDCVSSWSPSSFDDEDKMAKDQNLFDE